MLNWLSRLLLAVTLLSVAGCASQVPPETRMRARTIGVLSLLGDDVYAVKHTILFGGVQELRHLPGAGLDATAQEAVLRRLRSSLPQASVVQVDLPAAALRDKVYGNRILAAYNRGLPEIRPELAAWTQSHPVDLLLIVHRVNWEIDELGCYVNGSAFYFRGLLLDRAKISPVTSLGLDVWDGKTLAPVADHFDIEILDASPKDRAGSRYSHEFEENFAGDFADRMAADLRAMIAASTEKMLVDSGL
jgi:hypothetical protein